LDDADELKLVLARAFDRAWARYYRPGQVRIPPDVARPALAHHLVRLAKDGVTDEGKLAAGGVLHLFAITPGEPGKLSE
jgi:thiamine pyrophosphate-dependent acetolactate synthase large subunit-like protein